MLANKSPTPQVGRVDKCNDLQPSVAGHQVLLVEDDSAVRCLLQRWLSRSGFREQACKWGAEALSSARPANRYVALIDLGLPDMDGFQVARQLRESPQGPNCCLAALSGYDTGEHRQRAAAVGFERYFVKPIDADQLVRELQQLAIEFNARRVEHS